MEKHYKGFIVNDNGTVINKFGKEVGWNVKTNGYDYVRVENKSVLKHRFVWEAFNGEIPDGMEIDHINTVRNDNRLENLRVVSSKENKKNPITIERYKESNKGKVTPQLIEKLKLNAKSTRKRVCQYTLDNKLVFVWESIHECGEHGYREQGISACCNGRIKSCQGYFWSFEQRTPI
jgi:hypothetical protein